IVEQPAAGLQVLLQFVQLELNDAQGFHAAVGFGRDEIGFDFGLSFGDGLDQEAHVFVGILDTIKRGLEEVAHEREYFSTLKVWRRGWDLNPRYPLRYVRFRGGSFQPLTHLSELQLSVASGQWPVASCQQKLLVNDAF